MADSPRSSFHKKGAPKKDLINGAKPSLHNSQLLVSSGISCFDNLIGGGIPVGSLVLLNEDEPGRYSKYILKYFLAEGIVSNHGTFICSKDENPELMINKLPDPVDAEVEDEDENKTDSKKMTIAWRYENLKTVSFSQGGSKYFGHHFDLSKTMEEKFIQKAKITCWSESEGATGESFEDTAYWKLLLFLKKKLEEGNYLASQNATERNILRIVLHRMHSPLWKYDIPNDSSKNTIYFLKFLYYLRALIRSAFATCIVTIPFSRSKDDVIDKSIHLSDIAFEIQSFFGTHYEKTPPYKDYHGFFVIKKIAAINSLKVFNPRTANLVFKLMRKKFVIEEFHLPPEGEDSIEREQDDSSVLTCSSSKSKKLDF